MYQYPAHRISYQLVTFLLFHRRIFASAKKNIDFMKDSIDFETWKSRDCSGSC